MGRLVPEDFPLATLANVAERRVVEGLRDGLTDAHAVDGAIRQLDIKRVTVDHLDDHSTT